MEPSRCPWLLFLQAPFGTSRMRWTVQVVLVLLTCPVFCIADSATEEDPWPLQHSALGSDVLLRCAVPAGAAGVEWRVNGTSVATALDVLVATEDGLVLPNASLAQEGDYSCHHPASGEALRRIRLRLGLPPGKPAIECWAISYPQTVNCTWSLPADVHLDTEFIAMYRHGVWAKGGETECVQPAAGASSCSINDVQLFSITPYVLNITAVNPLGTATSLFPFIVEHIIRPDPPEDLQVSAIPSESKKLLLEWKPPGSWPLPEYFPLKYLIRYTRQGTGSPRTIGPYEQTSFILTGLRPGAIYHVQVAAKDLTDYGEYSAWSPQASGTPWKRR
ncbi:interleukin-27 subunit beta isoform X3 [Alligator mississippiensis]|uniref:interleukin-27 subunit beta isoform X3 n=1 Tax=Alligator mississippiensis TaxID=8496 RepID=UPI002877F090|nr:interleukin-27 subunit beta isoform X3 [Alligator mississippiensis]